MKNKKTIKSARKLAKAFSKYCNSNDECCLCAIRNECANFQRKHEGLYPYLSENRKRIVGILTGN